MSTFLWSKTCTLKKSYFLVQQDIFYKNVHSKVKKIMLRLVGVTIRYCFRFFRDFTWSKLPFLTVKNRSVSYVRVTHVTNVLLLLLDTFFSSYYMMTTFKTIIDSFSLSCAFSLKTLCEYFQLGNTCSRCFLYFNLQSLAGR